MRRKEILSLVACAIVLLALLLASLAVAAATGGSPSIEGVWSFNGGKVAVHPGPEGTLVGTVVEPTKFAECAHHAGEEMWTDMRLQPDGSYWGLHQWFYEGASCAPNRTLGPTAWRVMQAGNGTYYLKVCFSSPEHPTQPTIAPNGETANVSYKCYGSGVESGHVAELPSESAPTSTRDAESFSKAVSLPSNQKCFSRRVFIIHLHEPKYDPFKEVDVKLGKHRISVKRQGDVFVATIHLKGLPRGAFTIKIHVTTVLGHHLDGSRTYHTCIAKRKAGGVKSLKPVAHKHG